MNRVFKPQKINKSTMLRLFDVSLRDGIQSASPSIYTTQYKKEIFEDLIKTKRPNAIEIGSIVSPKVLPIMADSMEMHAFAKKYLESENLLRFIPVYMLIPSFDKFYIALQGGVENFSFITSVSEKFQQKNTRKTLCETKHELTSINAAVQMINPYFGTKLYISCINHCPIDGKIANKTIAHEINFYNYRYHFDELCMSDTCGTLKYSDYKEILDTLRIMGVPLDKLSLHLHVGKTNKLDVRQIVEYSLLNGVYRFDVSDLETGGCSVTMDKKECNPNMSYQYLKEIIDFYVE